MDTLDTFMTGCRIIAEFLEPHGFVFVARDAGHSSGGDYASGQFVRAERSLELHLRYSLGLVTYHVGEQSLTHRAYMRALLGVGGPNQYPGYSDDPLDGFLHLRADLERFCGDFVYGPGEEFGRCVTKAEEQGKAAGFKALHWVRPVY